MRMFECADQAASNAEVEASAFVPRRLSPQAGRALEMLGHAIEYLADEYAADPASRETDQGNWDRDPRVKAIELLKGLNRAVYYSGAPVEPLWQRIRRYFSLRMLARSSEGQ